MSTELVLPDEARAVPLPDPKHDGAKELWGRWDRLVEHIQHVPARQFIVALAAEVNGLPKETAAKTVVEAAFNLAVLGLIPGRILGHAHLVPFRMNRGQQNEYMACQLIVGYKGFLDLAYDTGFLRDVHCEIVLEGERYRRWNNGNGPQIEHELPLDRNLEWANVKAAYCIWHSQTGGHDIQVVGRRELDKLSRRGNVWESDPIAMALKTPVRRAAKMWKLTGRLRQAVTLDEMAEAGALQPALVPVSSPGPRRPSLDDVPETEPEDEPPADATSSGGSTESADNDPLADCKDYEMLINKAPTVGEVDALAEQRIPRMPATKRDWARIIADARRSELQGATTDEPKKPRGTKPAQTTAF